MKTPTRPSKPRKPSETYWFQIVGDQDFCFHGPYGDVCFSASMAKDIADKMNQFADWADSKAKRGRK